MTRTRRRNHRGKRTAGALSQLPWSNLRNPFPPLQMLSDDEIEMIHRKSLEITRDMGIEFMSPEARRVLRRAGADVCDDTGIVRFDPAMIEELAAKAPSEFTVTPRNPDRRVHFGSNHVVNCLVSSTPNISDLDRGRRPGTYQDQCNLIRLLHHFNVLHMSGVEPVVALDLPARSRHLNLVHAHLVHTDKAFFCRAIGREMVADACDLLAIALGVEREDLVDHCAMFTTISVNSPRRLDAELLDGMMEMMDHGQALLLSPFTLAGAMAPVTLAGALAQQNAEGLALVAFSQICRPGTPVVFGAFTSNVDMKTGAPAFGTPEYVKAVIASGQLIRRNGLPYRSSNVCSANAVDAQAAYESQMSLWACMLGGVNMVYHAAGWLEGGLTTSYEKLILDVELLQMMVEIMKPIEVSDATIALDAIEEVGIAGHFFGTPHTLARYETAFYPPILSDWRNFETWSEAGGPTATEHANRVWKQALAECDPPKLAEDRREAMDAFVDLRTAQYAAAGGLA